MRLVTVSMLGTALIAAGMLAPAAGEATATGQRDAVVEPGMVRPGETGEARVAGRLAWPDILPTDHNSR